MKKLLTIVLALACVLALAAPASADILWEPNSNPFYDTHHNECEYLGRMYLANSPEGFITAWDAPDGFAMQGQYPNGTQLWIYWVYENWGLISVRGEDSTVEGWVDLEEMSLVYDHISFAQDYADRITQYSGEFAAYAGDDQVFNFYEYPGAPSIKREMKLEYGSIVDNLTGGKDGSSYISSIFVDENGLTWGFVSYMYGHLSGWFCLDDPDGVNSEERTDFPLREVGGDDLLPAKEPSAPARSFLPYGLIALAVVLTSGILTRFFRKKKKQ